MSSPVTIYQAKGVRTGLMIVDDLAVCFPPPLPRVEVESQGDEANGLLFSPEMTERLWNSIVREVIQAEGNLDVSSAAELGVTLIAVRPRVTPDEIAQVEEMEKNTPPIEPERERQLELVRKQLKLVHFSVQGYRLQNRILAMPPKVTGLLGSISQEINQHLRTAWRLFTDPAENDPDLQELEKQRKKLEEEIRRHLKPFGHFGSGLFTRDMAVFQENVAALEDLLEKMRKLLETKLPEYIAQSRQRLVVLILERAREKQVQLPEPYLSLFDANISKADRQRMAAEQVANEIQWPVPRTILEEIKCQYSINDITLDHVQQESFRKAFRKAYKFNLDDLLRRKPAEADIDKPQTGLPVQG